MKAPIVTFNFFYLLKIKVIFLQFSILYHITKTRLFKSERNDHFVIYKCLRDDTSNIMVFTLFKKTNKKLMN